MIAEEERFDRAECAPRNAFGFDCQEHFTEIMVSGVGSLQGSGQSFDALGDFGAHRSANRPGGFSFH